MNVGFASTAPITWLQSEIAINPDTHIVITPSALNFGGSGAGSIHARTRGFDSHHHGASHRRQHLGLEMGDRPQKEEPEQVSPENFAPGNHATANTDALSCYVSQVSLSRAIAIAILVKISAGARLLLTDC